MFFLIGHVKHEIRILKQQGLRKLASGETMKKRVFGLAGNNRRFLEWREAPQGTGLLRDEFKSASSRGGIDES
jgi:hypothetical protein